MMKATPTPINVTNGMSLDDFMRLSHEQPFEIINGRRIDKMSTGRKHSEIIQKIFILLYLHITQFQLGRLYQETTFILPETTTSKWVKGSRMPDIMFYTKDRIETYDAIHPIDDKPFALVPDFLIEVISPTDLFLDVEEKIFADFDNGVKFIWLIDPSRKLAWIYTADNTTVQRFHGDGELSIPILPHFTLDLAQIWA